MLLLQFFEDLPHIIFFAGVLILFFEVYADSLFLVVQEGGVNAENTDWTDLYDLDDSQSRPASPPKLSRSFPEKNEESKKDGKQALENRDGLKLLPFEFIALEACLEAVCSCLDNEVTI